MTGGTSSMIGHTLHAGLPAFMLMARRVTPAFSSKTGNELVSLSRSVPEVTAYHGSGINWPREWGIPEYSRTPKTNKTTYTTKASGKA